MCTEPFAPALHRDADVPLYLDDSVDDYILTVGVYVQNCGKLRDFLWLTRQRLPCVYEPRDS
jgi:hypothetical protein